MDFKVHNMQTKLFLLLYIVLTIIILIGQEPPAYFENSRDSVDKLSNYMRRLYRTMRSAHCVPLAKEREHLNDFEWCGRLVRLSLYF